MAGKFTQINNGIKKVWDVERIWQLAEQLPVEEVEIESIKGIDEVTWFSPELQPTFRNVVEHCRRIINCELSYPAILTEDNCVFDGMHRIAHQMLNGKTTIKVKRFKQNPEPDEVTDLNNSENPVT
jgi:hypothetical protein